MNRFISFFINKKNKSESEKVIFGREKELALIKSKYEILLKRKSSGIVYIGGENGIGKSYLVSSFVNEIKQEAICFYLESDGILKTSLNPFVFALKEYFEQLNAKNEDEKISKYNKIFDEFIDKLNNSKIENIALVEEIRKNKMAIGAVIGLYTKDPSFELLNFQQKFEYMAGGIKLFLIAHSLLKPVVVVLEDFHWTDNDTISTMKYILKDIEEYPILALITGRLTKEGIKPFFDFEYNIKTEEIYLEGLSGETLKSYIEFLNKKDLDTKYYEKIERVTYGNPFYVKQYCKFLNELSDEKITEEKLPLNINEIIMQNIEKISYELKKIIKNLSFSETEFGIKMFMEMMTMINYYIKIKEEKKSSEEILKGISVLNIEKEALNILEKLDMKNLFNIINELKYVFHHSINNENNLDIAYKERINIIHQIIAEVYENLYGNIPTYYSEIAYHYEKAENFGKSKEYLKKTGDYFKNKFMNNLALEYYQKLINYTISKEEKVDVNILISELFYLLSKPEEGIKLINDTIKLTDSDEKADELRVRLGRFLWQAGMYNKGIEILNDILKRNTINNKTIIGELLYTMGLLYHYKGSYDIAVIYYKQALEIYKDIDNRAGIVSCYNEIGSVYNDEGEYNKAMENYRIAIEIGEKKQGTYEIGFSYGFLGETYLSLGEYDKAVKYLKKAISLGEEFSSIYIIGVFSASLGYGYYKLKKYDDALKTIYYNLLNIREVGIDSKPGSSYLTIALILQEIDKNSNEEIFEKIAFLTDLKLISEIFFEKAIEISENQRYHSLLIQSLLEYGVYLLNLGNKDAGYINIYKARKIAEDKKRKGDLRKIDKIISEISDNKE